MTVSAEEVQFRSYLIWEKEGRPFGRDQEHWFRAQAELAEEAATIMAKTPAKRRATTPKASASKTAKAAPAKKAKASTAKKQTV